MDRSEPLIAPVPGGTVKIRIRKAIEIAAPPETIWPWLTESDRLIRWVPVEKIEQTTPGKLDIDTRFYFEEKAAGFLLKLHLKVTECVEHQKLAFCMVSGNTVRSYSQWYSLERLASGCRFSVVEDVTMPYGIVGRTFGLFRVPVSNGRLARMLQKLKALSEVQL